VSWKDKQTTLAAMSIDIEDWFQVQNLGIDPKLWESKERRVEQNVDRMLTLLNENNVTCTCFCLGWIAERHPETIQKIAAAGHEIASHGYNHELAYDLTHEQFRKDIGDAKKILEDLTGKQVVGYRAPCFSITDWTIDILQEEGYTYDSSSFATIAHDRYGSLSGLESELLSKKFAMVSTKCVSLALTLWASNCRGLVAGISDYSRTPFSEQVFGAYSKRTNHTCFIFTLGKSTVDNPACKASVNNTRSAIISTSTNAINDGPGSSATSTGQPLPN